jgi:hypothetical protein
MPLPADGKRHRHGNSGGPGGTESDTARVRPDGHGASRYTHRHNPITCARGLTQQRQQC